ncbi:hypothetical protein [Tengunoibacter tsumagoiensis]|uniref:Uncharacterized protein n=1 Tax=Tengunoibacter tsumagoiensis TaxID=2014871 RepID=A0A402A6C7_9CHLR|nr:hypothetical protein [Tengunoibacter tsumagoiensis]GCE14541.1 hypothetical protein KTT_44000 [Tengunoibacter tsumagoiensis]
MLQHLEIRNKHRHMKEWTPSQQVSHLAETSRLGKFTVCGRFTDYPASNLLSMLILFPLYLLVFSAGFFWLFYLIMPGNVLGIVCLLLFGMIPLSGLAYVRGKKALKARSGGLTSVYFYQQGFVSVHDEQSIALRWDQIERVERIVERVDDGPVGRCQILLMDGSDIILMNCGRRDLHEEIRRRVMRSRKGYQHRKRPVRS